MSEPAPARVHSIRVIDYGGDFDDLDDVVVIGPYETAAERDADLRRLAALPEVYGFLDLQRSRLDPDGADYRCTPFMVREVKTRDELLEELYGLT